MLPSAAVYVRGLEQFTPGRPTPGRCELRNQVMSEHTRFNAPAATHDVLKSARNWLDKDGRVVLATVVGTWGSAPVSVGGQMAVAADGRFEGSVSGGCVEGAVVTEAIDVIGTGKAKMLEFGVADETAWRVGLSCGGRIKVYVERLG